MIVSRRDILAHVRHRTAADANRRGSRRMDEVLRAVLGDQELRGVDSLVEFCSNPDNLAKHVSDPDARSAAAAELTARLSQFKSCGYGLPTDAFVG